MTRENPSTPGPLTTTQLGLYGHICLFVSSREEQHQFVDPFVRDGYALGDRITYVVSPADRAEAVRHLRQSGYDVSRLLEQRRFEFHTWTESYLNGGSFDVEKTLHLFDDMLGGVPPPRIRLIADMGWAVEGEDFTRAMLEYEARGNQRQAERQHFTVCVYDTTKFGGDVLMDVLRTHPAAVIGGILHVNPFFVAMAEFIEELRSREQPA